MFLKEYVLSIFLSFFSFALYIILDTSNLLLGIGELSNIVGPNDLIRSGSGFDSS